jgi:hypothetical protein
MIQRGRKSAAAASVVQMAATPRRPRLSPPSSLSTHEQSTFKTLLRDNPHLTASDEPLLTLYVQALEKAAKLARGNDVAAWEKAVRLALSVGTKLRVTPQSTQDPQALGRRKADHRNFPEHLPWSNDLEDEDEDEVEERPPRSVDFRSESQRAAGEKFPGNPDDE